MTTPYMICDQCKTYPCVHTPSEGKTGESSDLTQPHQYDEPQPQQFTVPLMPAQPEQLCPQCGQSKDSPGEDSIERLLVCGASFHTQPAQVVPPTV